MIPVLIWLISGAVVFLVLISRKFASVQEDVENGVTILAAWTLIAVGSATHVLDPLVIPTTNFLSRQLKPKCLLDRALVVLGRHFGDALAAGDSGPVAEAAIAVRMKRLFEKDFPSDLLPDKPLATDLVDRLVPYRGKLSAVNDFEWDAAVEFALRTFALVACMSVLCMVGALLAGSLQWFLRAATGGFLVTSGASLLTLASAVHGFRIAGLPTRLESRAGGVRSWVAELQTASEFLLPARDWKVEAGTATAQLGALGIVGAQHADRPIVFDDSTMTGGLSAFAKQSKDDAIRLAARIARSWLLQHRAGLIAVDLTGQAAGRIAAAVRSVRGADKVHDISTRKASFGIDIGREIDDEEFESVCLLLLKPDSAVSVLAASTVRQLRALGSAYQGARRLSLAVSGPADTQSLQWALEAVIHDSVEEIVDRIETVRRADLGKIEFEADPKLLEERKLRYACRFAPEVLDAIGGLRREWLAAGKNLRGQAGAVLKAAFNTILDDRLWRSHLLRENPLQLSSAAGGSVFVFSTPGRAGATAAALAFAAAASLYRSLGKGDEIPFFLTIGLDVSQAGQSIVLDLLGPVAGRSGAENDRALLGPRGCWPGCGEPRQAIDAVARSFSNRRPRDD